MKKRIEHRRVLAGSFTYARNGKWYPTGGLVPFVDFDKECSLEFRSQFSEPVMSRRTKPAGSGSGAGKEKKKKKGSDDLSNDTYEVVPVENKRYYYNVFLRETGELLNEAPIHKKDGVRAFQEEDQEKRA